MLELVGEARDSSKLEGRGTLLRCLNRAGTAVGGGWIGQLAMESFDDGFKQPDGRPEVGEVADRPSSRSASCTVEVGRSNSQDRQSASLSMPVDLLSTLGVALACRTGAKEANLAGSPNGGVDDLRRGPR